MSKTRILYDYAGISQPPPDAIVVAEPADYVVAYGAFATSVHLGQGRVFVVRDQTSGAWLAKAAAKYGALHVEEVRVTPRAALERLWGVVLPDWLTDQMILNAKLLDYRIEVTPGQHFEDALCAQFYSPALGAPSFQSGALVTLAADYDAERWGANQKLPLVQLVYERRLKQWEERGDATVKAVVTRLRREPGRIGQLLGALALLRGYPADVGRRALGEDYEALRGLSLDWRKVVVREHDLPGIIAQVEVHLATLAALPPSQALDDMLGCTSGRTVTEFRAVRAALHAAAPDATTVKRVREHFTPARAALASELDALALLIEPARPSAPDPTWPAERWQSWAITEYLPYHAWLEERGTADQEVADYAERFGDWFYGQFLTLAAQFERMVHRVIYNLRHELAEEGPCLVLMLDSCHYRFLAILTEAFARRGYARLRSAPYFSMLPTDTEVAKRAFFAVEPETAKIGGDYKAMVETGWTALLKRPARYLPNVGEWKELTAWDAGVYALNFLATDSAQHEDEKDTGRSHTERVRDLLEGLAGDVDEMARRLGVRDKLRIYAIADHGATKIPTTAVNVIGKKDYDERSLDKRHRFVTVSDEQMKHLPGGVAHEVYPVPRQKFGTKENYLIARRSYRFSEVSGRFYVHGGLTPEETIVPLALFQRAVLKAEPPTVVLLVKQFRYGARALAPVEITNTNDYPLSDVCVRLSAAGLDEAEGRIAEVPARAVATVEVPVRFSRRTESPATVKVSVEGSCGGQDITTTATCAVTLRSMMESRIDKGIAW